MGATLKRGDGGDQARMDGSLLFLTLMNRVDVVGQHLLTLIEVIYPSDKVN